jgi:16S rRNA (guanine527-N7)-methyltransferase
MDKKEFYEQMKILGHDLSEEQKQQFDDFYVFLIEWNKKINLTTIIEEKEVYLKHFYDSATLTKIVDFNSIKSLCDVGSGAGFPGIVIKILYPNIEIDLIDSLNKRVVYLNQLIEKLKLNNIKAIHNRIEEYGKNNREKYDVVTARAVAPMSILLEYCIPITKVNGLFVAMKSNISQEIIDSENLMKNLSCNVKEIIEFELPKEKSKRTLIKIIKTNLTEKKYPRHHNLIKKEAKK